jgi:hypothetical protein
MADNLTQQFLDLVSSLRPARVLEVGTLQWVPGISTHHMEWFPYVERSAYTMADIALGADVDRVVDVHELPGDWTGHFDAFVAAAVWEHLQRPWIAAREVAKILSAGGICYIETHQTFPLHAYPDDYFRFSREALALIFDDVGLNVVATGYKYRAKILGPPEILSPDHIDEWNEALPSWLNVVLIARKP